MSGDRQCRQRLHERPPQARRLMQAEVGALGLHLRLLPASEPRSNAPRESTGSAGPRRMIKAAAGTSAVLDADAGVAGVAAAASGAAVEPRPRPPRPFLPPAPEAPASAAGAAVGGGRGREAAAAQAAAEASARRPCSACSRSCSGRRWREGGTREEDQVQLQWRERRRGSEDLKSNCPQHAYNGCRHVDSTHSL